MAGDCAETSSRTAQRAKLEAEILYIERQIRVCKEAFGVKVFDIFLTDPATVRAEHATLAQQVDEMERNIAAKRGQIDDLKAGGTGETPAEQTTADGVTKPVAAASVAGTGGTPPPPYQPVAQSEQLSWPAGQQPRVPSNQSAPAPAPANTTGGNSGGMFATMMTAAVASSTGGSSAQTDQLVRAAAPHVAGAMQQRYSGDQGMQKMASDAQTMSQMGAAVANNPAVRQLGAALLSGALSGAASTQKR